MRVRPGPTGSDQEICHPVCEATDVAQGNDAPAGVRLWRRRHTSAAAATDAPLSGRRQAEGVSGGTGELSGVSAPLISRPGRSGCARRRRGGRPTTRRSGGRDGERLRRAEPEVAARTPYRGPRSVRYGRCFAACRRPAMSTTIAVAAHARRAGSAEMRSLEPPWSSTLINVTVTAAATMGATRLPRRRKATAPPAAKGNRTTDSTWPTASNGAVRPSAASTRTC
jgi:hypothetical protein